MPWGCVWSVHVRVILFFTSVALGASLQEDNSPSLEDAAKEIYKMHLFLLFSVVWWNNDRLRISQVSTNVKINLWREGAAEGENPIKAQETLCSYFLSRKKADQNTLKHPSKYSFQMSRSNAQYCKASLISHELLVSKELISITCVNYTSKPISKSFAN